MELLELHMNAHAIACSAAIYVLPYVVLLACCTRCTCCDILSHQPIFGTCIGHERDSFDVIVFVRKD